MKIVNNRVARRSIVAVFAIAIIALITISVGNLVYANSDKTQTTLKIAYSQINKCIVDDYFEPELRVEEFSSLGAMFPDRAFSSNDAHKDGTIWLPSKYGHSVGSNTLSCYELFAGASPGWFDKDSWHGIAADKFASDNKETFLKKFGYVKSDDASDIKKCVSLHYKLDGYEYDTDTVCLTVEKISGQYYLPEYVENLTVVNKGGGTGSLVTDTYTTNTGSEPGYIALIYPGDFYGDSPDYTYGAESNNIRLVPFTPGQSWDDFYSYYSSHLMTTINADTDTGKMYIFEDYGNSVRYIQIVAQSVNTSEDGVLTSKYVYSGADITTIKEYLGANNKFLDTYDLYSMYDYYMFDIYGLVVDNTTCRKRGEGGAPTGNEIYTATSTSEINICAVTQASIDNAGSDTLFAYSYESHSMVNNATVRDIIKWNQMLSIQGGPIEQAMANKELIKRGELGGGGVTDPTPTTSPGSGEDDGSDTNKLEEACYENAKSLGWVICPMIFGLREVTESIYEFIEPLIRVDDTIVSQLGNNNSNLFKAWNTFRGFANIIFVILFMFVIFSQLTGVGIDNYGIKKMLPKLILTAILVNVSFVIAAIAVDASNIVGHSIEGLFEKLGGTIMMMDVSGAASGSISGTVAINDAVGAQSHIVGEVVSWLVVAVAAGGVGLLLSGWAIIIPILLFLLTTIISIIFALIILGLRQAIVIILITLAPVAFACNALPNTEPLFKKWLNVFKGILVVYPVIGALIGAGYFTSSLIYTGKTDTGTDLIMTLVAGLISVIPYFLIPSLTRKSLDGIGMLGSKLAGAGKTFGGNLKRGINNTDYVNNAKADSKAGARRFTSGLYMKTLGKKTAADIASGKKISTRRANTFARNANLANTKEQANISARTAQSQYNRLQGDGYTAAMSAAGRAEEDMAVKNFETLIENGDYKYGDMENGINFQDTKAIGEALEHELSQSEDKIDANKIRALQNVLNRKGDNGRNAIFNAMAEAQRKGNVSAGAIRAFSSNIMNNQGDYKASHRSLYEYAKDTAVSGSGDISSYKSRGVMALTQNSFLGTDKTQMDEYVKAFNNGELDAENAQHLRNLAHGIAENENVHGSIRVDDYGEALRTFAPDVEWDKVFSGQGNGLKVDHSDAASVSAANHDAAMAVFQDRINRKVADGTYTQEQANRLMDKAKAHMYDKDHNA